MINHITLNVTNKEKSAAFYAAALAPLGYKLLKKGSAVGVNEDSNGWAAIWLREVEEIGEPRAFACLAFTAVSKDVVQKFYEAALAAGGTDNGAPGYRPYAAGYYAAFVLDPDGHNIEVIYPDPNPPTQ